MKWLSPDSAFMRGWNNLADAVWINIMMLISSIPIITIGAALTAGHDACRRSIQGEGKVTANYIKAFKTNFVQATLIWIPYLLVLVALVYSWVVLQITPLLIPKFGLTILWAISFEWVFALQARFENPVGRTMLNSLIFSVSYPVRTIALLVVDAVFIALIAASWMYMPQGLFLLAVLGYGMMLMLHIPVLENVFGKYVGKPSDEAARQ